MHTSLNPGNATGTSGSDLLLLLVGTPERLVEWTGRYCKARKSHCNTIALKNPDEHQPARHFVCYAPAISTAKDVQPFKECARSLWRSRSGDKLPSQVCVQQSDHTCHYRGDDFERHRIHEFAHFHFVVCEHHQRHNRKAKLQAQDHLT